MNKKDILIRFQEGQLSLDEAASQLEGVVDIGFASLDRSRNKIHEEFFLISIVLFRYRL